MYQNFAVSARLNIDKKTQFYSCPHISSCYTALGIASAVLLFIMKLEELIQQRNEYGAKILKLAIQVAGIFLIPILLIYGITLISDIKFIYLFPVAFIISWLSIFFLYRKISREVKDLDRRIRELRAIEATSDVAPTSDTKKL